MDFKSMMASRKNRIGKVQEQLEKESNKGSFEDTRFWKLQHQDGNGSAIIRFLPETNGEDILWAKYYRHEFKGQNGWLMDNCPTSLSGQKCPICEANSALWSEGGDDNEKLARERKRKLKYISNVLIVKDAANPENEGKVFLYQYGKMIHDMIESKISPPEPEFKGEAQKEPVDVFDFLEGCNFRLRMKKKGGGYPTYESSEFDSPSQIAETDEEIEEIWNSQHSLTEFVSVDNFKSYEELSERFQKVLGVTQTPRPSQVTIDSNEESSDDYEEVIQPKSKRVTKPAPKKIEEDVDDEMAFFNKLAEE